MLHLVGILFPHTTCFCFKVTPFWKGTVSFLYVVYVLITRDNRKNPYKYRCDIYIHGATAPGGPGPPHPQGFTNVIVG